MIKKFIGFAVICMMVTSIIGCAKKDVTQATTANHQEAIAKAQSISDMNQKHDFLLSEMQGFMNAGKYKDAALVGEYIVDKVNAGSEAARRLLRKAYEKSIGDLVGGS